MNLQELFNETMGLHGGHEETKHFEIVAWNGKERVKLLLDGIDDAKKVIVLVAEDFYQDKMHSKGN
jgi:hypothetical protein